MIRMVKLDNGNFVPEECCSFTNPLTSGGKSEIDDIELPCESNCENDCDNCTIQKIMNEYGEILDNLSLY